MTMWAPTRLKFVASMAAGGTPPVDDPRYWTDDEDEGVAWAAIGDMTREPVLRTTSRRVTPDGIQAARLCVGAPGTLLFAMYASLGATATLAIPAAWNQAILGLTPRGQNSSAFLKYSLIDARRSLSSLARTNTQDNLNQEQIGNLPLLITSPERQALIADFLDRECERIDAARQLGSDLAERTNQDVRGELCRLLDDDERSCPNPRLRWVSRVLSGFAFPSEQFVHENVRVRLLRGINVGVGQIRWDETVGWDPDEAARYAPWRLRSGDLVLGMDRPWIAAGTRVATISPDDVPALLLQRVACIRPNEEVMSEYVRLWIEHPRFEAELASATTGVSVPHISGDQIGAFRIAVPDLDRQRFVVERARSLASASTRVHRRAVELDALLTTYGASLIQDGITGKLNITAALERGMEERLQAAVEGRLDEVAV